MQASDVVHLNAETHASEEKTIDNIKNESVDIDNAGANSKKENAEIHSKTCASPIKELDNVTIVEQNVAEWTTAEKMSQNAPICTLGIDEFVGLIKDDDDKEVEPPAAQTSDSKRSVSEQKQREEGILTSDHLDDLHTSASQDSNKVREEMRTSRDDAARNRATAISQIQRSVKLLESSGDGIPEEEKKALLTGLNKSLQELENEKIIQSRRGSIIPEYSTQN